jgi:cell wall-associated NlpC family hydrolase
VLTYAVAVGVADVRRDPDPTSEQVTQALLNAYAVAGEVKGEWTHTTLSDYEGWIRSVELAVPPVTGQDKVAVITVLRTVLHLNPEGEQASGKAYLSSALPLLDDIQSARVQVALPGGGSAWIARSDCDIRPLEQPYPLTPVRLVTDYARSLMGVPYLWGGTSVEGIDCSGLTQLSYRMGGSILPRDANQQFDALVQSVKREEMREGDLIFFGSKSITHVALALNEHEYIHAEGRDFERVMINSLNPADEHYNQRLGNVVWGLKRVI